MNTTQFIEKIREITNTTASDYSNASLIRDLNSELSLIQINILRDRGVLEFDDTNFTNLPIGDFAINSSGVCKIVADQGNNVVLSVHKVAYLVGDRYVDVPRIILTGSGQEILTSNATRSVPEGYYEVGASLVFPGVSSGTVRIWFDREMNFLTTGDTTKVPGIPSAYHNLAAYRTAYNYAIDKGLSNENSILRRVQMEEERLEQFEKNRRADEPTVMSVSVISGI